MSLFGTQIIAEALEREMLVMSTLRSIERPAPRFSGQRYRHDTHVTANIGRNHPDYGRPLADHVANKGFREPLNSKMTKRGAY